MLVQAYDQDMDHPLPAPPASSPIKPGYVRLFHGAYGEPQSYRAQGISLDYARGESYGEPNRVWAIYAQDSEEWAHINRGVHMSGTVIEFAVPADDPALEVLQDWSGGHVALSRSIQPEEIIAVHEQWHHMYRGLEAGHYKPHVVLKHGDEHQQRAAREFLQRAPQLADLDDSPPSISTPAHDIHPAR